MLPDICLLGKKELPAIFLRAPGFRGSEKAAGKYIHVPMHIWMAQDIIAQDIIAQDIIAQGAAAFDSRQINSCSSWTLSCTSLSNQGAPQTLFLSCGHPLC